MRLAAAVVFASLALTSITSIALADTVAVNVDVNVDVNVNAGGGEPVVVVQPPPPRQILRGNHWELGAFIEAGRIAVDGFSGGQVGVRGELARQIGAFRIGLEYSVAKFDASRTLYDADGWFEDWEDTTGEVARAGITARLRTATTVTNGCDPYADIAFYIEGGLGHQRIAWEGGGSSARPDFMLGTGFEVAGGSNRIGGFDLNVRAVIGPSLDRSVETHEVSILGGLGGRFGI